VGRRRGLPGSHADGAAFVAVWIILSAAPQPRSPVPATLPSLLRARARPHFPGHGPSPLTHAVAGPALTDVRVADRPNPLIPRPCNYLRLTRLGDRIDALLFVWWFGNVFEAELPLHPSRRCTTPTEAGRLCVQEVSLASRDWRPLMQMLLEAQLTCLAFFGPTEA
jgi:hypothetical protein